MISFFIFRRSMGCGIKNQPPIFGKIWQYLDWIKDEIKDAILPMAKCFEKPSPMQKSLEDKIKEKGPGFIQESLNDPDDENTIKKVEKTLTFESDFAQDKDFDVKFEALFDTNND